MSYKALYRTYRPQTFEDVAGQSHVTITLKNAIKENRIAHAYLFAGPRGTGKTTIAKILAKAINCTGIILHVMNVLTVKQLLKEIILMLLKLMQQVIMESMKLEI